MSETVEHQSLNNDAAKATSELLGQLNLTTLSFVQLRRLQNVLKQAAAEISQEITIRAEEDKFGDTITAPPQKI